MILNKEHWSKFDIEDFQKYLLKFKNENKNVDVLKTNLPVLFIKTIDFKNIVEEIYKGNYIEFLDLMIWEYYENTVINGFLINKIDDFNIKKKYLDIYSSKADNWATCDLLTFNVSGNETNYFNLAKQYSKSKLPFVRRIGMYILFHFIESKTNEIFEILDTFTKEEDYYVNMMNAWLLSECFIKQKEKTLIYLNNNKLNKFIINKGIQKCRDSRRVSIEDKNLLLKYKVK